jgi:hypothetical protein
MDTAPRSAFLAGIVESHERTAMMGFVYIARSSASSAGPIITGVLAGKGMLWVAFVVAGSLMVVYDLGVLVIFGGHEKRCQDDGLDGRIQDEENNASGRDEEVPTEIAPAADEEKKFEVTIEQKELEHPDREKE